MKKHFGFGKKDVIEICCFDFILLHNCNDLYSSIDIYINVLNSQKKIKTCIQNFDDLHDVIILKRS